MEEIEKTEEATVEEAASDDVPWAQVVKNLRAEAAKRRVQNTQLKEQLEKLQAEQQQQETAAAEQRGEFEKLWQEERQKRTNLQAQLAVEADNGTQLAALRELQAAEMLSELGLPLEKLGLSQEDDVGTRLAALRAASLQKKLFRQVALDAPAEKLGAPPPVDQAAILAQMGALLSNTGQNPHKKLAELKELEKQLR